VSMKPTLETQVSLALSAGLERASIGPASDGISLADLSIDGLTIGRLTENRQGHAALLWAIGLLYLQQQKDLIKDDKE